MFVDGDQRARGRREAEPQVRIRATAWNGLVHMTFWSRTTFLTRVLKAPGGSFVATVPGVATRSAADSTLPLSGPERNPRGGLCEHTHAEQNSQGDGPPEMPRQRTID